MPTQNKLFAPAGSFRFHSVFFMAMDLGMAVGAYFVGVLAGFAGLGAVFITGANFAAITLAGFVLLRACPAEAMFFFV